MINLDSALKSRGITLWTKVCIAKAMIYPVVMCGCQSWTIKKAEHRRIDALELWCLRRFSSILDSKEIKPVNPKGNQPWIFIGRLEAEAEAPMLWPPDGKRADSLEKTLILGKTEGRRRSGQQRMRWLDGITDSMNWVWVGSGSWWWTGKPGVLQSMKSQSQTQLSDWTELNWSSSHQMAKVLELQLQH